MNTGDQFACAPAIARPHVYPPFHALFRHPLSAAVFLLSLGASLSLCAFISCFNLLSFSRPECCQFSSHSAHTFFQSLHLSFPLSASSALFLCALLEQPDSGKWRDNPWDFQGFKVFVLANIKCTQCNHHKHTNSMGKTDQVF